MINGPSFGLLAPFFRSKRFRVEKIIYDSYCILMIQVDILSIFCDLIATQYQNRVRSTRWSDLSVHHTRMLLDHVAADNGQRGVQAQEDHVIGL